MALKRLEHLNKFCSGIHAVDAVDIPQLMKTLFADADTIPQFVNAMEAAQRKSNSAKHEIQDKNIHTVSLQLPLKSGEYKTETRE